MPWVSEPKKYDATPHASGLGEESTVSEMVRSARCGWRTRPGAPRRTARPGVPERNACTPIATSRPSIRRATSCTICCARACTVGSSRTSSGSSGSSGLGSITTILPASRGPARRIRSWARISLGAPPLTRGWSRPNALSVAGPQVPSGGSPRLRWKSRSADSVSGPKYPSTRPTLKPMSSSRCWSANTSSPAITLPGRWLSTRSPSVQRASSSRRYVEEPTTPSTVRPRCCWKLRTASSTLSSYAVPATGSTSRSPIRSRSPRISATAGPESPRRNTVLVARGSSRRVLSEKGVLAGSVPPDVFARPRRVGS